MLYPDVFAYNLTFLSHQFRDLGAVLIGRSIVFSLIPLKEGFSENSRFDPSYQSQIASAR
jgi:hypothetical protein